MRFVQAFPAYCVLACSFLALPLRAELKVVEEIVCKINGDIITRSELDRDRANAEAELRRQGLTGARLQQAVADRTRSILRDRIDQLLLVQKGKELNINVDSDVNKQLADIQRRVVATDATMTDPDKFQQFVREQTGQSFEDYKSELKNSQLTQRVVRDEVSSKIRVKREELQEYYNAHKNEFQRQERVFLREILISTERKDQAGIDAAEKKAKDMVARARRGERFPEMAQANSDSPTAPQGGALDPAQKGVLDPRIESAVWNQPRGYVTDPIKITGGFLILKVDDHQKAGLAELEEVENEISEKLFSPRMEPAMRTFLTKLRQEAFLEIKAGYEDSGAAPGKDTAWSDPAQLKPETITKEEVAAKGHRKRLLKIVPIPGTTSTKTGTSSSR